jgi:hypothetical protein
VCSSLRRIGAWGAPKSDLTGPSWRPTPAVLQLPEHVITSGRIGFVQRPDDVQGGPPQHVDRPCLLTAHPSRMSRGITRVTAFGAGQLRRASTHQGTRGGVGECARLRRGRESAAPATRLRTARPTRNGPRASCWALPRHTLPRRRKDKIATTTRTMSRMMSNVHSMCDLYPYFLPFRTLLAILSICVFSSAVRFPFFTCCAARALAMRACEYAACRHSGD